MQKSVIDSITSFRGKNKATGKWLYGIPTRDIYNKWYIDSIEIDPETLSQYSGMDDKFGKQIYAGDTLTCMNAAGNRIYATCKFGKVNRLLAGDNGNNLCTISGFYLEVNGNPTFPIVNNYLGKHDLEILQICSQ